MKIPAHGPTEMPVWGAAFKAMNATDEAQTTKRIENLTDYLRSIQVK